MIYRRTGKGPAFILDHWVWHCCWCGNQLCWWSIPIGYSPILHSRYNALAIDARNLPACDTVNLFLWSRCWNDWYLICQPRKYLCGTNNGSQLDHDYRVSLGMQLHVLGIKWSLGWYCVLLFPSNDGNFSQSPNQKFKSR